MRVAVVGAGFSGLAAAAALCRGGARVVVLEARERVGGRVATRRLADGTALDLGAQWIGPTQDRMAALVAEHGLTTFPSAAHGRPAVRWDGRLLETPPESVRQTVNLLDELATGVDPAAPWRAARADEWDRLTLGGWLTSAAPDPVTARYVGRLIAGGLLAVDPDEVSLLQVLFYLRSGGGSGSLLGMAGGAQQDRLVGGPALLAERMAAALPPGTVRSGAPVRAVHQDGHGVVAYTDEGAYRAEAVVVAVAPALAGRIAYAPALPALRDALTQRMPMGSALKLHAVYPTPFWRADGWSG
ncbi:flavin monoamine oxidase family protein [Micromonospora wenchangensis]|uniref:flavin monoamine oxidase family protein n=1 Tax=Micromonospora wenchangensis TaxID=1185415 RepID=UPI003D763FC3